MKKIITIIILLLATCSSVFSDEKPDEHTSSWPRNLEISNGKLDGILTIFQPQLESFTGTAINARAAFSLTLKDEKEPVFGVLWLKAKVATDREKRIVKLLQLNVPKAAFPGMSKEKLKEIDYTVKKAAESWDPDISLDRLLTMLDKINDKQVKTEKLKMNPPEIILRKKPAILVPINGEPKLETVRDTSLLRVVNSQALIVLDTRTRSYYLKADCGWMSASDLKGNWKLVSNPPKDVIDYGKKNIDNVSDSLKEYSSVVPEVIVSTVPAELVVFDGEPQFSPIAQTGLLYVSNTEDDVFLDLDTRSYYILLTGRWFASSDPVKGWQFVPPEKLPKNFAEIPEDNPKANVLASVPGTEAAKEAVIDAQIPQTAKISRNTTLRVTYNGAAQFKQIEGTNMQYAVNTDYAVLKINNRYYCCHNAVWFVSGSAGGPWLVCTTIPDEIQNIPPSCPLYYVKYTKVYDYDEQYAYVGYTPGYNGSYVYDGTVVYGTGYDYNDWWDGVYYQQPCTYGTRIIYNSYSGGWIISGGWGWYRRPNCHYRHYRHRKYKNRYHRWGNKAEISPYKRKSYSRNKSITNRRSRLSGSIRSRSNDDLYASKSGTVYRRTNKGWEQRKNGRWQSVSKYKTITKPKDTKRNSGSYWPVTRYKPSITDNKSRYRSNKRTSLEKDYYNRKRGSVRESRYQKYNQQPVVTRRHTLNPPSSRSGSSVTNRVTPGFGRRGRR